MRMMVIMTRMVMIIFMMITMRMLMSMATVVIVLMSCLCSYWESCCHQDTAYCIHFKKNGIGRSNT